MRAMVLNGSPHRSEGSTGRLSGALIDGMRSAGAHVEVLHVYDLEVEGCRGCFSCWIKAAGSCVIRDDMDRVLPRARDSKILVLATPVYCDGMTGPTKMVVDRMIPLVYGSAELRDGHMRHPQREDTALRTLVLVSTCGFVERDNFDPLIQHTRAIAANMGLAWGGCLTLPGGLKRGALDEIGPAAREAGEELVRTGMIPEHLEAAMLGHSVSAMDAVTFLNRRFQEPEDKAKV